MKPFQIACAPPRRSNRLSADRALANPAHAGGVSAGFLWLAPYVAAHQLLRDRSVGRAPRARVCSPSASASIATIKRRQCLRLCPVKPGIPFPSSGAARGLGKHKLKIPHPHRPPFGDAQGRVAKQSYDFREIDMAVAAMEVIEKAFPVGRGPAEVT